MSDWPSASCSKHAQCLFTLVPISELQPCSAVPHFELVLRSSRLLLTTSTNQQSYCSKPTRWLTLQCSTTRAPASQITAAYIRQMHSWENTKSCTLLVQHHHSSLEPTGNRLASLEQHLTRNNSKTCPSLTFCPPICQILHRLCPTMGIYPTFKSTTMCRQTRNRL